MKILNTIRGALEKEDFVSLMDQSEGKGGKITNALIGLLADSDEIIKWNAVYTLGKITARLYSKEPEGARKVIRQLIWNLNEESGGIGWGMPEAFGEILALIPELKQEYACLLTSYLSEEKCFIENEHLQIGLIWALGRLKKMDRGLISPVLPFLLKALLHPNPLMQGTAAWASGEIGIQEALPVLRTLQTGNPMVKIYSGHRLQEKPVGQWAKEAIIKIEGGDSCGGK